MEIFTGSLLKIVNDSVFCFTLIDLMGPFESQGLVNCFNLLSEVNYLKCQSEQYQIRYFEWEY